MKLIIVVIIALVLFLYLTNNKCNELFSQSTNLTEYNYINDEQKMIDVPTETPSPTISYQEELMIDAYKDIDSDLFSSTSHPLPNEPVQTCSYISPTPDQIDNSNSIVPTYTPNMCSV